MLHLSSEKYNRYSFAEKKGRCWEGYEPVPGKKPYSDGSCRKKSDYAEEEKKKKKGKVGVVQQSDRPKKKFKVLTPEGKTVHFGHSDYNINVGKDKGKPGSRSDSYCARSAGIKDKGKYSPNALSRRMWGCKGKQGGAAPQLKVGDKI